MKKEKVICWERHAEGLEIVYKFKETFDGMCVTACAVEMDGDCKR